MNHRRPPAVFDDLPAVGDAIGTRDPVFFLDFDGTLAPLVSHPDEARMSDETRDALAILARAHVVCVISGRGLRDLRAKVGLRHVHYAADHGYRMVGPEGSGIDFEVGPEDRTELEVAAYQLDTRLRHIGGAVVESKDVSLSVHYRMVPSSELPYVHKTVGDVVKSSPGLRLTSGKMVHEIRPDVDWGKGRAVLWLLKRLRLDKRRTCPICVGDDLTDEDMFAQTRGWGVNIVVGDLDRPTQADFLLRDCGEVVSFLRLFHTRSGRSPV